MDYFEAVKNRRSVYGITAESTIPDSRLEGLLIDAVQHAPSSFDSRSSRVVLLLEKAHQRLWDIVLESLRPLVPEEKFGTTQKRISSFADGYGTVLFFEDDAAVKALQERYPMYGDRFPVWAEQSSGMLQYLVWTGMEAEGLGASIQHYNPIIDAEVAAAFEIPESWRLIAQMPFGTPLLWPAPRKKEDVSEKVRVVTD